MAFERYFKDRLAGLQPGDDLNREQSYKRHLVYQGAPNNPPDAMYAGGDGGDAFEFKKFEGGPIRDIPLNSSWPKDRLTNDSYGLTDDCRDCEPWTTRDLFYVCGGVPAGSTMLSWIWICDAKLMAAESEIYANLHRAIQSGIAAIPGVRFAPTVELGKVRELDPAKTTHLRIRGMWTIGTPGKIFRNLSGVKESDSPTLHALLRTEKWNALPAASRARIESFDGTNGFSRTAVSAPDPNRQGGTIPAILIRYEKDRA
jgi:hypothetical protein